jgi:hypothetical protein
VGFDSRIVMSKSISYYADILKSHNLCAQLNT